MWLVLTIRGCGEALFGFSGIGADGEVDGNADEGAGGIQVADRDADGDAGQSERKAV